MSKLVYYKFKSELNQQQIPFEGSNISVKELTEAIRKKHTSSHFNLVIYIKDIVSKEERVCSENELIPAFSNLIIKRLPLTDQSKHNQNKKITNPENFSKVDPYKNANEKESLNIFKRINLDSSSMTEEQKVDTVIESAAANYRIVGKKNPTGRPPSSYTCNKCNIPGHWINNCPGIPDKNGKLIDSRQVKRPSGIPVSGLVEVDENTPNSYLTPDGRYVVNIKNRDAFLKGKKDKRPFSIEENPPLIDKPKNDIPEYMVCRLCSNLITAPTKTGCCGKTYCRNCITDYLFDPENSTPMHQCPNCLGKIDKLDDLIDDTALENHILNWNIFKVPKIELIKPINIVKSEEKIPTDDDLLNEIFSLENKENDKPTADWEFNSQSVGKSENLTLNHRIQPEMNPATDQLSSDMDTAEKIRKLASAGCAQGIVELMKSNPKAVQLIQGIVNSLVPDNLKNYKNRSRSRSNDNHHRRNSYEHRHPSRHRDESRNSRRKPQKQNEDRQFRRSSGQRHREDDSKYPAHRRNREEPNKLQWEKSDSHKQHRQKNNYHQQQIPIDCSNNINNNNSSNSSNPRKRNHRQIDNQYHSHRRNSSRQNSPIKTTSESDDNRIADKRIKISKKNRHEKKKQKKSKYFPSD